MSRTRAALAALLFLAGCGHEAKLPAPNVVATLGGRDIHYGTFERYLERNVGESGGALASEALSRLFDQFLGEEALAALARERGFAGGGETAPGAAAGTAAERAQAADDAIGAMLAASPRAEPTAAELEAEYLRRRAGLAEPERVHLKQILVEDRLAAERARRELAAGADFDAVVTRLTPAGAAPAGADQGELAREDLPPAFAAQIFALKDGGVSDVVPAAYGFHVFQVVRHLPPHEPTLAEAEPELRDGLRRAAADAALAALAAEARSRYTVTVYDRNLPFTYRGAYPTSRPDEKH